MSPIKGTHELERLPRLGKIRLGIHKDHNGNWYPEPTDYFVCPEEVKKVYGEKPRELRIVFLSNRSDESTHQCLRCYSHSRHLICRGNGRTAITGSHPDSGDLTEIACDLDTCAAYRQRHCRLTLSLVFLLLDCPEFGVYQLDTSSLTSIVSIQSGLEYTRKRFGRIDLIPFTLTLEKREVQVKGESQVIKMLNLVPAYPTEVSLQFASIPFDLGFKFPPLDIEAPDDLLPVKPANKPEETEEDKLQQLWDRVKSRIWHMDIQTYQIESFFNKSYQIEVGLKDFFAVTPAQKFTITNLTAFLQDIEKHTPFAS